MKYIGLMHYFLRLEVWQRPEGIFLNQGKYTVEILIIFYVLDCKSMATPQATPMDTNLKLLSNEALELVEMTQYIQIIGSLMYLMNTRTDICFVVNTLS